MSSIIWTGLTQQFNQVKTWIEQEDRSISSKQARLLQWTAVRLSAADGLGTWTETLALLVLQPDHHPADVGLGGLQNHTSPFLIRNSRILLPHFLWRTLLTHHPTFYSILPYYHSVCWIFSCKMNSRWATFSDFFFSF